MSELVKLESFLSRVDAEHVKSLLDAENINSVVQADDVAGFRLHLNLAGTEIVLLVKKKDFEKAKEILKIFENPIKSPDEQELEINMLEKKSRGRNVMISMMLLFIAIGIFLISCSFAYSEQQKILSMIFGILFLSVAFGVSFTIRGIVESRKKLERIKNKKDI